MRAGTGETTVEPVTDSWPPEHWETPSSAVPPTGPPPGVPPSVPPLIDQTTVAGTPAQSALVSETVVTNKRGRIAGLAIAGILGLAAVGAGGWYLWNARSSADDLLWLTRSDDLYVATLGEPVERDDRVIRDYWYWNPITVVTEDGFTTMMSAEVDGWQLLSVDTEDERQLVAVGSEETIELLVSDDVLDVMVLDDEVLVREIGSSDKCYRGTVAEIDDVFRGDHCEFAFNGDLLTADVRGEVVEVEVFDREGTVILEGNFDEVPLVTSDGTKLVVPTDDGIDVLSVATGRDVFSVASEGDVLWRSGPRELVLVGESGTDGSVSLTVHDSQGGGQRLASLPEGMIEASFTAAGDVIWMEIDPDGGASMHRWSVADASTSQVTTGGELTFVGMYGDDVVLIDVDDSGLSLQRVNPSGVASVVWDHPAQDQMVGYAAVRGDAVAVTSFAVGEGGELAALVPLDGGEPTLSDGWDFVVMLDHTDDAFFVSGRDGEESVAVLMADGAVEEMADYPSISHGALFDDVVLVTAHDDNDVDTFVIDRGTGEIDETQDLDGYSLVSGFDFQTTRSLTITGVIDATADYCRDLEYIEVGQSITIDPLQEICMEVSGPVVVSIEETTTLDPTVTVYDMDALYLFDDDSGTNLGSRLEFDVDGIVIIAAEDYNGGSVPILIETAPG